MSSYHTLMRCLLVLLLCVVVLPVWAHPQDEYPQANLQITIDEEAVELIVSIPAKDAMFDVFDGLSPVAMDEMDPDELAALVGRVLATRCPVKIDGVVVPPVIFVPAIEMRDALKPARAFPESQVLEEGTLKFVAYYETKGRPRRVDVDWSIYANLYDDEGRPVYGDEELLVPALLIAEDRERFVFLTPKEPGFSWHSEEAPETPDVRLTVPERPYSETTLPVLSLAVFTLGGLGSFFIVGKSKVKGGVCFAVTCLASGLLLPVGNVTLIHAGPQQTVPANDQALAIFESLHRNIYRAFDYTDEGLVYDALSQSVHGPMLETIYNDVYQSLIMREENGAVSKVVRVEIEEARILPADETAPPILEELPGGTYRVHCAWQVDGVVTHFDHTHARTNAFEAVYTVASIGEDWRIVDAQILQQQRVDDGTQTANDLEQDHD